jgi:hypothetical protein
MASRNFRACTGVFERRSRPAMMTDVVIIANGCLPAVSKICSAISIAGDMRWKTNGSCRSALTIRMWCSWSQQHSSRNRRPVPSPRPMGCGVKAAYYMQNIAACARARRRWNVRRCIPFGLAGKSSSRSALPPSLILIFRACSRPRYSGVCCWLA